MGGLNGTIHYTYEHFDLIINSNINMIDAIFYTSISKNCDECKM
jgi:hypothetical protein